MSEIPASKCVGIPSEMMGSAEGTEKTYLEVKCHTGKGLGPSTSEASEQVQTSLAASEPAFLFLPSFSGKPAFSKIPTFKIHFKTHFLPSIAIFMRFN